MPALVRWRTKAAFLAAASRTAVGRAMYRTFQDIKASRTASADMGCDRALDLLGLIRKRESLRGRSFLEIGTGWCPWVPLVLLMAGARLVVTVDVNPWLSHRTAVRTTRALLARVSRIGEQTETDPEGIRERLSPAVEAPTLDAWLSVTGIRYIHGSGVQSAGLPASSFDGVVSSNVLEHVTPEDLLAIHLESARLLRPGGFVAHRFNPQDHFSVDDRSITGANFLQFSAEDWHPLGGSGLAYHNRLRCPQHLDVIRTAGLSIVYSRTRQDPKARAAIESEQLHVHPDFAGMEPGDLSDDYMWVVAQRGLA